MSGPVPFACTTKGNGRNTENTMTETGIFDSHAHYDDRQFDADRETLFGETLPQKNVCGILNVGADLKGCRDTLRLAETYGYVYGAVGIHPECAADLPADWLPAVAALAKHEKIVAIGEIGLDYHWLDVCPKATQKLVFRQQLELAAQLDLPVVVHDREAHGDVMEYLQKFKPRGVLHCFSGSVEMAREVLKLGMYIGLGGVVTFKNARHAPEVAADIPLDRLLLETDAPYMAPEPFRGKRNDSSLIRFTAEKIAEIRGLTPQQVLCAAAENTKRLFQIA